MQSPAQARPVDSRYRAEDHGCVGLERDALAWPWLIVVYAVTIPFGGSVLGSLVFGGPRPGAIHPPR